MPQLGPLEIAVVLLVALLVFGPGRLPEMAKQVGGALKELRRIQHTIGQDLRDMMQDESDAAAPPPSLPPKAVDAIDIVDPHQPGTSAPAPAAEPPPPPPPPPPPDPGA